MWMECKWERTSWIKWWLQGSRIRGPVGGTSPFHFIPFQIVLKCIISTSLFKINISIGCFDRFVIPWIYFLCTLASEPGRVKLFKWLNKSPSSNILEAAEWLLRTGWFRVNCLNIEISSSLSYFYWYLILFSSATLVILHTWAKDLPFVYSFLEVIVIGKIWT